MKARLAASSMQRKNDARHLADRARRTGAPAVYAYPNPYRTRIQRLVVLTEYLEIPQCITNVTYYHSKALHY